MELIVSKVCALILLAALRLLAGLLPLKIAHKLNKWSSSSSKPEINSKRKAKIDLALSVLLCFGAGLLLATCFVHMLPEVRESFSRAAKSEDLHWVGELPVAELLTCTGFLIVYFLEEIGEKFMSSAEKETIDSESSPAAEASRQQHSHNSNKITTVSTSNLLSHSTTSLSLEDPSQNTRSSTAEVSYGQDTVQLGHSNNNNRSPNQHNHGHSHSLHFGNLNQKPLVAALRGLLIIMALSFHSVFEGMAIGLQLNVKDVWFLFAAVSVHELAIIFCVGLELLTSSIRTAVYVVYMVSLALITPLGLGIGILVTEYSSTQSISHIFTVGILQAMAAGTILYVTFFEVLDKERKKPDNRIIKFFCFVLGFVLMVVLETAGGGHSHGETSKHTMEALSANGTSGITTQNYSSNSHAGHNH